MPRRIWRRRRPTSIYRRRPTSAGRYSWRRNSVSRQDADEKAGDIAAKKASRDSAGENVRRLNELEGFRRLYAPFDGVVTARNTDIGNLINAGQASGGELFRVSDTKKLRIYAQVPEVYADATQP